MLFFFCQIHTKFTEISAKISTEYPLYRKILNYRQVTCTHPLFITYTRPNHFKSQTSYNSRIQIQYPKYSSYKVEHNFNS